MLYRLLAILGACVLLPFDVAAQFKPLMLEPAITVSITRDISIPIATQYWYVQALGAHLARHWAPHCDLRIEHRNYGTISAMKPPNRAIENIDACTASLHRILEYGMTSGEADSAIASVANGYLSLREMLPTVKLAGELYPVLYAKNTMRQMLIDRNRGLLQISTQGLIAWLRDERFSIRRATSSDVAEAPWVLDADRAIEQEHYELFSNRMYKSAVFIRLIKPAPGQVQEYLATVSAWLRDNCDFISSKPNLKKATSELTNSCNNESLFYDHNWLSVFQSGFSKSDRVRALTNLDPNGIGRWVARRKNNKPEVFLIWNGARL